MPRHIIIKNKNLPYGKKPARKERISPLHQTLNNIGAIMDEAFIRQFPELEKLRTTKNGVLDFVLKAVKEKLEREPNDNR